MKVIPYIATAVVLCVTIVVVSMDGFDRRSEKPIGNPISRDRSALREDPMSNPSGLSISGLSLREYMEVLERESRILSDAEANQLIKHFGSGSVHDYLNGTKKPISSGTDLVLAHALLYHVARQSAKDALKLADQLQVVIIGERVHDYIEEQCFQNIDGGTFASLKSRHVWSPEGGYNGRFCGIEALARSGLRLSDIEGVFRTMDVDFSSYMEGWIETIPDTRLFGGDKGLADALEESDPKLRRRFIAWKAERDCADIPEFLDENPWLTKSERRLFVTNWLSRDLGAAFTWTARNDADFLHDAMRNAASRMPKEVEAWYNAETDGFLQNSYLKVVEESK